ncbi:hypothetical protein G9F32_00570 [Acinetobacter sp. 194]|uniref:hypothetical protein n=1 Tax=Acinetobacter shaoyimingii TaxID=2715164 RepID=UPI00140989E3|nr:hypothetical protein [Acinetobacter shaoyimingii]NHB56531.1 hypothetical protein [Acinetobacter shaoyimingii]
MLDSWYSNRCNREIKFAVVVSTCVVIYLCSIKVKLAAPYVIISVLMGMAAHYIRSYVYQSKKALLSMGQFKSLFLLTLVIYQTYLIFHLDSPYRVLLMLQNLGFVCIGIFICSIYTHQAKRHSS